MQIELTNEERVGIEAMLARERRVRHWRRYQAIRLLAEGHSPRMVAATLGVSVASVYNWAEAWKQRKQDGMQERARPGRARRLDAAAEGMLATWLSGSPSAYGHQAELWTVPLLRAQLAHAGYAVSEHTLRRTLHRLGWRWKRTGYVLASGRMKPGDEGEPARPSAPEQAPVAQPAQPAINPITPILADPAPGVNVVTG